MLENGYNPCRSSSASGVRGPYQQANRTKAAPIYTDNIAHVNMLGEATAFICRKVLLSFLSAQDVRAMGMSS